MGTDARKPIVNAAGRIIYGSGLPGAIWQKFMNTVLAGTPKEKLPDKPLISGDTGEGLPEPTTEAPPPPEVPTPTTEAPPPPSDGNNPDGTNADPSGSASPSSTQGGVGQAPGQGQLPGNGNLNGSPNGSPDGNRNGNRNGNGNAATGG
jgi:membrane peptidoglycan carboxypeptidase